MTPNELRKAREDLGLTLEEAARLLDMKSPKSVQRMERDPGCVSTRDAAVRVVRLYRAYQKMIAAGIWPDDWPARLRNRKQVQDFLGSQIRSDK